VTSLVASSAETAIGGYTIHGVLGRGGMGVVYRATHPDRDEQVALKVIAPSAEWDETAQSRFKREIRAARAVSHRHILPVYDAGEADGRLFVAMKLVESGDLGTLLRHEGRLAPPRVIAILRQVAGALDAAHAHGLVHRDVKPGNVLVEESGGWGNAYLADFGVTTVAFTGDAAAAMTGTVGYSAPEQIRGETVDARGDVYALGCVLYECLTGHLPFERRDAMATLWGHLYDDAPAPSTLVADLPARLDAVMRRALAKDPRDRYASAGAFAEAAATSLAAEHGPEAEEPEPELQLPIPPTTFVGRERELVEASAGLRLTRMLTVTGPGGAGKTRFALELAQREAAGYPDGVFACFLASLRDPSLVSTTVCQALGVQESPDQTALDALSAHLSDRRLLLLVDNVEHVREGLSDLEALLRMASGLTVITTSRERLRFPGEAAYALPALGDDDSVLFFCDRSGLDASETVEAICARLDGLPLALELAAARAEALTPEALLDLLSRRLDALEGDPEADPRQETLRATIKWSYDLLSDDEKRLFAALSVFAGGCTLEAAEQVCRASEKSLQLLVDKSLLQFTDGRYSMLETIREFAAERLQDSGEESACRLAHAEWFVDLAERLGPGADQTHSQNLFDGLERELGNFREALAWAAGSSRADVQLSIAGALRTFLWIRGPFVEGRGWLEDALASDPSAYPVLRARALMGAASLAFRQQDQTTAEAQWREAAELYRQLDDGPLLGRALSCLHLVVTNRGDYIQAEGLFEEALPLARQADDLTLARLLSDGGLRRLLQGDYEAAAALFRESLERARSLDNLHLETASLLNLGVCTMAEGRVAEARPHVEDSVRRASQLGDAMVVVYCLETFAALNAAAGAATSAARLLGAAAQQLQREGGALEPFFSNMRERAFSCAREALGPDTFAAEYSTGSAMSLDEAVAYALGED
jgi:predicted ATPase